MSPGTLSRILAVGFLPHFPTRLVIALPQLPSCEAARWLVQSVCVYTVSSVCILTSFSFHSRPVTDSLAV